MEFKVEQQIELFRYLSNVTEYSKNKIKSLLKYQNVLVNGKIVTQYNYLLKKNDNVEITKKRMPNIKDIEVLYEDDEFLVINKKAGLLTIATSKEKVRTLFHYVYNYVKEINKNNKIFIVHRLDKETSGIVLFAKNEKIKQALQDRWNEIVTLREYQAVVEGVFLEKSKKIEMYLIENKEGQVYKSKIKNLGKLAITKYNVVKHNGKYSLVNINIETGRKNQIRVAMAELGRPIVGDKKYKAKSNPCKRLMLHATKLEFIHPITKKKYKFTSNVPNSFNILVR